MLWTKLTLFLVMLWTAGCETPTPAGMREIPDFGDNPGNLQLFIYTPATEPSEAPLVVVLHGCGQSAAEMARVSGWNELADTRHFIVLYPQQKVSNNLQNCFNWYLPTDTAPGSGEARSIEQMIRYALDHYDIDSTRIFITGLSAGGAMTSVMLADYPARFRAGAIMSGIPYGAANDLAKALQAMRGQINRSPETWGQAVKTLNPAYAGNYPAVAVFHGVDDPIVDFTNAGEITEQWRNLHGLDNAQATVTPDFGQNPFVKQLAWADGNGTVQVLEYELNGLGHAIAVDPGTAARQGGQTGDFAKDIDFYSSYWAAQFFGIAR